MTNPLPLESQMWAMEEMTCPGTGAAVGIKRLNQSSVLLLRSRLINGLANVYLHYSSHILLLLPRDAESWGKPTDRTVLCSSWEW